MITSNNTLGTTPTAVPGVTTATGTQTNRINRNGMASACGSPKIFPGTIAVGPRAFDSYTFTACRSICLKAGLTGTAINLFQAAYSPSFVPANIATNYVGDAGVSGSATTCAISTTASTPYTFVLSDLSATPTANNHSQH